MEFNKEVGKRIKTARNNAGLSLKELGEKVNLSEGTMQRYETGQIKGVDVNLLKKIANALNCTDAYLMGWEEDVQDYTPPQMIAAPAQFPDLSEQIKKAYGEEPYEALQAFSRLDTADRAEIRGEMKQMLKADKYAAKKGLSSGQAM